MQTATHPLQIRGQARCPFVPIANPWQETSDDQCIRHGYPGCYKLCTRRNNNPGHPLHHFPHCLILSDSCPSKPCLSAIHPVRSSTPRAAAPVPLPLLPPPPPQIVVLSTILPVVPGRLLLLLLWVILVLLLSRRSMLYRLVVCRPDDAESEELEQKEARQRA